MNKNICWYKPFYDSFEKENENYVYDSFTIKIEQLLNPDKNSNLDLDQDDGDMDINNINRVDSDKKANFIIKTLCTFLEA